MDAIVVDRVLTLINAIGHGTDRRAGASLAVVNECPHAGSHRVGPMFLDQLQYPRTTDMARCELGVEVAQRLHRHADVATQESLQIPTIPITPVAVAARRKDQSLLIDVSR